MNMFEQLEATKKIIDEYEGLIKTNNALIENLSSDLDPLEFTYMNYVYGKRVPFYNSKNLEILFKKAIRNISEIEIVKLKQENQMYEAAIFNIKLKLG